MRKLATWLFFASLSIPGLLLGHEGHKHVMGTVIAVDGNHVEVKTRDGKSRSVPLNGTTRYYQGSKGTKGAVASDLKVGARVVIDLAKNGTAEQVRVPAVKRAN